ncbi:hypothetical protein [Amycolatopsis nigrescens]|uniref:hypothetical protein n=1 Tax=Amycolatopsis nigrescens TaxID=381445 RepID=UPI000382A7DE|nr:hypothetical protein [Amycolatopsis nigrescens]
MSIELTGDPVSEPRPEPFSANGRQSVTAPSAAEKTEDIDKESPSIYDLMAAHRKPGRAEFAGVRTRFQREQKATVVEEYYARTLPAAVVLVRNHPRPDRRGHTYQTKMYYDASISGSEIDDCLRAARRTERQSSVLLNARTQEILAQSIYTLCAYLLSLLDALPESTLDAKEQKARVDLAVQSSRRELVKIETFVRGAARSSALVWYLIGIVPGMLFGFGLVAALLTLPYRIGAQGLNGQLALCVALGAIGAMVSVMVRVTRRQQVDVDWEHSRGVTMLAGAFRPVVGAVFGAVLFILVMGGLVPLELPDQAGKDVGLFFAGLAFLAGFSERWAQDTIVQSTPRFGGPAAAAPARKPGTGSD